MVNASTTRRTRRREPAEPDLSGLILKQPDSGEKRRIAPGFAWDLFLFAPVLGIPLFLRRLPQWGAVILALWLAGFFIEQFARGSLEAASQAILFLAFLGLQLWLGFKGNALTAKAYMALGWAIDRPDQRGHRELIERWGLAA